jgi:hypothetical protein
MSLPNEFADEPLARELRGFAPEWGLCSAQVQTRSSPL